MNDLPQKYDVIIAGTGLTESILSAALARVGKTVFHIDRNEFYGGEFASHSLSCLIDWTQKLLGTDSQNDPNKFSNNLKKYFTEIEYSWNTAFDPEIEKKLLDLSRKFLLDLSPNILYARGDLVELLISSDVAKYCEFKMVSQILTITSDGLLQKVPTSRSEVFKSTNLSMLEKRAMMQFVQACLKEDYFKELIGPQSQNLSFQELIRSKTFPKSINDILINAVAMSPSESDSALKGLEETRKFLSSVSRFGDSPFLFPMYGVGELSQCFCRMAAVFGAIYYLNLTIDKINSDESNLVKSVKTLEKEENFECDHLVIDSSYAPLNLYSDNVDSISHCILITDNSIYKKNNENHISFLFLPKCSDSSSNIYLIEVSYASNCCPEGYFLVYLFCENKAEKTRTNFEQVIKLFFTNMSETESDKPNILFSYYFSHLNSENLVKEMNKNASKPDNLHIVSGARVGIDFDHCVKEAKRIFNNICPDQEFMPKPPDPEDIIIVDSLDTKVNEPSSETA